MRPHGLQMGEADEEPRIVRIEQQYRFVTRDGRASRWRRIPERGITGVQFTRARRKLGETFALEMRPIQ